MTRRANVPTRRVLQIALLTGILSVPALSNVIFDNIEGPCNCSLDGPGLVGAEFTPSATYRLTDVAAFMANYTGSSSVIDFFIYSNGAGVPVTELTALTGTIAYPLQAQVDSGAPSVPLTLVGGTSYWFVIDLTSSDLGWEVGSTEPPYAYNIGAGWVANGPQALAFEVDGTPAGIPEPGALGLAGSGIVLAILARRRRVV
jgi:hypothetical protein